MFQLEQDEYVKENIAWQHIKFLDNSQTIDLIENTKATSLFGLLDEQFMLQGAGNDTNLLKNYNTMLNGNQSYKRPDKLGAKEFIVCHYAGEVTYEVAGFVEKNKDSISSLITETLA
jgi:myosin-5